MQDILSETLIKLKRKRVKKVRMLAILLVLSLLVSLDVFWSLRQPGLTLAGDADCGIIEHTHSEKCQNENTTCQLKEHIHTIECYSDETADVETVLDWQKMFENYPYTKNLAKDLVGIAKTQVGYSESKLNFQVDQNGVRHGYTRYGAWYGTPYSNWSATFVSFCLHYAGANENQFPLNSGADSMAAQWKALGKYKSANSYQPIVGDLIFFKDNTVGIISDILNASCYVIRGDIDGCVDGRLIQLADDSIEGYGQTSNSLSFEQMLDISKGPAVFIFDNSENTSKVQLYKLKNTRTTTTPTATDLVTYLNEKGGSFSFTLLDAYNHEVPKDANGNLMVHANNLYKLTLITSSPKGFSPGAYQYKLPDGVKIEGGENGFTGDFILSDKTNVGSWSITEDGVLTINFNDKINTRTDVTISSTIGISFPENEEPIDFDGKIMVTVEKPREEISVTEVRKWGVQGSDEHANDPTKADKTDETKLYWTVYIEGNQDSNIPGSTIQDNIVVHDWSHEHIYTEADMAAGLRFGASVVNPNNTEESYWHRWTVYPGDENLTWTETGWTYTMPETVWCELGHEAVLGNEYWTYYIEYTSTPKHTDFAGELSYTNTVTVEDITKDGWGGFTQTDVQAAVFKNGTLVTDANGAKILWEINATVPKKHDGKKADCYWNVTDSIAVINEWGNPVDYIENTMKLCTVTANYHGNTINVPYIYNATKDDPYALVLYDPWQQGFYDVRQFMILRRCECTQETCPKWNNGCGHWEYIDDNGNWYPTSDYCDCWLDAEDTTFTFTYETDVTNAIAKYSGLGYKIKNIAALANNTSYIEAVSAVPLPGIIEKEGSEFKDLIAKYTITVNESKLNLTDGAPLIIHDEMTETLTFMRGTLVIKSVDAAGNEVYLQENVDYTYTYDGTGTTVVDGKKVHVLEIEILHPQPVTYFLEYDTTLYIPPGTSEAVKYENSATVTLWNKKITNASTEGIFPDINIASNYFAVSLHKTSAVDGRNLAGAEFGLFNEQGGLIVSAITDRKGEILFETDIADGIILREHELYYLQEINAPPGYRLDDTKHWFCFCSNSGGTCDTYQDLVGDKDLVRIPFESVGQIDITNNLLIYDLPATGGPGIYPLIFASVLFIVIPLVYKFIRRRKRERRGVG